MQSKIFAATLAALTLTACGNSQEEWTLTGHVPAGTEMVVLNEPTTLGGWYAADSVAPDKNGNFTLKRHRAKGSIFRIDAGGLVTYVPADSTETLSLEIGADGRARLSGSAEAELFTAVDSIVMSTPDSLVTKALLRRLDKNLASQAAYYATRRVSSWGLLRPVTNRHLDELPDNPRTAVLNAEYERMRRQRAQAGGEQAQQVVITAPVTSYFDIELMDRNGQMKTLGSVVDSAPVAVLAFVDFAAADAPAAHVALGEANSAGVPVYEVGFAENQYLWANGSENLPWTNVYQSVSAPRIHLQQYVVNQLPTFFVFRNGEIAKRVTKPSDLKSSL